MTAVYKEQFNLEGKTALVTGGAGILGTHFCSALAASGANIVIVDIQETAVQSLAENLENEYGVKAIGCGLNVADAKAVSCFARDIEKAFGPIDILHNNAASKGKNLEEFFALPENFSSEVWRDIMEVNLDGVFYMAREFGSRMAMRGSGSIIQTASIYGLVAPDQRIYEGSEYMGMPINTPAVYSASKAGVIGLTKYFASYWGSKGVRVNTLTPGGVESGQNDTFSRQYSARIPMKRMAQAHEMTGALIFLASDASSYITGQNIVIDGGLTAW